MSEEKTNIRPVPVNELSIAYEIGLQSSLDARLTVDSVEMLNEPQSWYRIKRGQKIAVGYKGMPVSCKEDASLYILQSDAAELTNSDWAKVATQDWVKSQGYVTSSGTINTGDSSLGCSLYRWLTISSSGGLSTTEYTLTGINIKTYGEDTSFSVLLPTEAGTLATQQWVEAQGYGQGSGSIDTSNLVTLDGEQTISGNKTFTGEVDFSNATVKGLAIDPADVDLAGYATQEWVEDQGFVTASYLDNVLTFSTSGSEVSAVNYSNDEVLFTEDLYVTNPMGDFVSGDNVKGLSLQEIITRLLKLETNI